MWREALSTGLRNLSVNLKEDKRNVKQEQRSRAKISSTDEEVGGGDIYYKTGHIFLISVISWPDADSGCRARRRNPSFTYSR